MILASQRLLSSFHLSLEVKDFRSEESPIEPDAEKLSKESDHLSEATFGKHTGYMKRGRTQARSETVFGPLEFLGVVFDPLEQVGRGRVLIEGEIHDGPILERHFQQRLRPSMMDDGDLRLRDRTRRGLALTWRDGDDGRQEREEDADGFGGWVEGREGGVYGGQLGSAQAGCFVCHRRAVQRPPLLPSH